MAQLPQAHHTIAVRDPAAMEALFGVLGFSEAPAPPAGLDALRRLRNPTTGQELVLAHADAPRDSVVREGDVSVGIPVGEADLHGLIATLQAEAPSLAFGATEELPKDDAVAVTVDGVRLILTRKREPFFVIHYSPAGWKAAGPFYEGALGFCFFPLPNRGEVERTRFENAGGRVDIEISAEVAPSASESRFRLITGKMEQAAKNVEPGQWAAPPANGAGIVRGPFGELIELVDRAATGSGE